MANGLDRDAGDWGLTAAEREQAGRWLFGLTAAWVLATLGARDLAHGGSWVGAVCWTGGSLLWVAVSVLLTLLASRVCWVEIGTACVSFAVPLILVGASPHNAAIAWAAVVVFFAAQLALFGRGHLYEGLVITSLTAHCAAGLLLALEVLPHHMVA